MTAPMITAKELKLLGAWYLINVGRGSLVDPEALIEALERGDLKGAGLDVTAPEPLPEESPLWSNSRVIITSHSAGRSKNYGRRWGEIFSKNLHAFQFGGEWRNLVSADSAAK